MGRKEGKGQRREVRGRKGGSKVLDNGEED